LHKHGDILKGLAYSFEKIDGLCRVCKILFDRGVTTESRAMYDDSGAFYLLMYDTGLSAYSRLDAFSFITEFATREGFSNLVTYLSEHGHTICDNNAIATLGSL
jgi:negative regulator of genetic competence, sporulation and motility